MTHFEKCHIDGDTTIHDELVYIGQTTCGRIEIPIKGSEVKSICTSGDNDKAVETLALRMAWYLLLISRKKTI